MDKKLLKDYLVSNDFNLFKDDKFDIEDIDVGCDGVVNFKEVCHLLGSSECHKVDMLDILAWVYCKIESSSGLNL